VGGTRLDAPTRLLSEYAASLSWDEIPEPATHAMKRCLVDGFACAAGGLDGEPVRIARRMAATLSGEPSGTVLFTGERTAPDMAAFVNGMMVRYLDFNDTYRRKEGGHPSDVIGAVLAAANMAHADGRRFLLGMTVAYEIFAALAEAEALGPAGIDHPTHTAVAAALGAGKVLGLDAEGMANALSLALVPNVTLRATREGRLSMWKAGAAANACRNGLFAARLAAMGMTAPPEPFMAPSGLRRLLGAEPAFGPLGGRGQDFHAGRTNMKYFPAEYHAQAPIWAALDLRERMRPDAIAQLTVYTYEFAFHEIGSGDEKWRARDRDTADHSLPYIVAAALEDGTVGPAQFDEERIRRPSTQALMGRIAVREDPELTRDYPSVIATRIEATDARGRVERVEARFPKGHTRNPLSDDDLERKFRSAAGALAPAAQDRFLDIAWSLDRVPTLDDTLCAKFV